MKKNSSEGYKLQIGNGYDRKLSQVVKISLFLILTVLFQLFANDVLAQQRQITGSVTDDTGEPIVGATIVVEGTTTGTVTDVAGEFTLTIPPEANTLIFSFVGMITQSVDIGTRQVFDIVLQEDFIGLEEVVAIGYGTARRVDLTSSVSTVTPDNFSRGSFSSPVELLQGRVPGLNITKDGNPYGSADIVLRGPSTLRSGAAQQPLFVIDGVPGASLDGIPSDDIISIDVLRDASATAIYGSRAANGVILVTTRRGEEGITRTSYNGYMGVQAISNKIDMMTTDEYRAYLSQWNMSMYPDQDQGQDHDWFDVLGQSAISQQHNLAISGGTASTSYLAGVNYLQNQGLIQESGLERFTLRANVDQKALNDRLTVGVNLNATVTDQQHIPEETFEYLLTYNRTVNIYNPDGSFYENPHYAFPHRNQNPLALIKQNYDDRRNRLLLGSIYGQLDIVEGLVFSFNASYQNNSNQRGVYNERESSINVGYNGYARREAVENEKKLMELFTTYSNRIDEHNFSILGGYSWQEDATGNGFQADMRGFPSDVTRYYNLGLASPPSGYLPDFGTTNLLTLRMISGYARFNYGFDDRYLLQATIRRDGSSAFGELNRWGTFPSASVAWRLTEEAFMDGVNADIKLRISYGRSGNSLGFNPLISRVRYGSAASFWYNNTWVTGVAPTQNPNPDLRWETTDMFNIGTDWSTLQGRLSGTIEYYNKTTDGLIWNYPVSTAEYFVNTLTANVGQVTNRGYEFTFNIIPVHTNDFFWNSSFNFAHNRNEVTSLSDERFTLERVDVGGVGGIGQTGHTHQVVQEGYAIGQFYTLKYAGRNEAGTSQFYRHDGTTTTNPSMEDRFYFGSAQPKATFGFSNNMTYRNFDINFFFRGVTGNYILNASKAQLNRVTEANVFHLPRFSIDEPANDVNAHFNSDRFLEKGDFLRLDNITLGYTFQGLLAGTFENLRIYSTINNVFIITNYTGLDPEINIGGITPGLDNSNYYPKTRTFMFGLNVDF